jgi:hypothetical protein
MDNRNLIANYNSYYKWNDHVRNLIDQQNRWEEQLRASSILNVIADVQRVQDQFRSFSDLADVQKKALEQSHISRFTDAMAETQRLQDQFRSFGELANVQKKALDQSHISRFTDAMAEAQRIQDQFSSFTNLVDIQKKALEQSYVSRFTNVMAEAQRLQEQFRSFGEYNGLAAVQRTHAILTSSVITRLNEMAENLRDVDCVINPDGTITSKNSIFNQSEIQTIIESYLETSPEADNVSFEIKIGNILNDILKHHPVISKIIVYLLLPFFISIFSTIYFSPPVQIDYTLLAKQLKEEVRQIDVDIEFYKHYRFVSAEALTVRSNNSTRSRYVGKLYFGYLVRIIQKKKNWSLIEYRDKEGNIIIQGWVFTRYIKRFDQ